jgi:hypothetical protein
MAGDGGIDFNSRSPRSARQLRHGEIGNLTETIVRPLRLEVLILLKQADGEPNLPAGKAYHSGQQHRKPPSCGYLSQNP